MKKTSIILALIIMPLTLVARQSPVELVFKKYAGIAGITSVQISPGMFNMLANMDPENEELHKLTSSVSSVLILHAPEKTSRTLGINFYDEVLKDLPVEKYEELMKVSSPEQQVLILAEEQNGVISELLLLVGGNSDNALICIKGALDMRQITSLSQINAPGMEHFINMQK